MSDTAQTSPQTPENHNAVHVCASGELVNGGLGVKIPVTDGAGNTTAFFVRYQNQVYGYLNRCAHVGVELDWENSFFTRAGDLLMCAPRGGLCARHRSLCWRPLQERPSFRTQRSRARKRRLLVTCGKNSTCRVKAAKPSAPLPTVSAQVTALVTSPPTLESTL